MVRPGIDRAINSLCSQYFELVFRDGKANTRICSSVSQGRNILSLAWASIPSCTSL